MTARGPDYAQLLCDIAIDLLVNQADPPEYVSAADADWLIAAVRARKLPVMVEFQLLTQVMHYAVSIPPALSAFCLAELEKVIIEGAPDHPAGVIQPSDTEALREAVFATDEGSSQHVTRDEAEALFRIAHATAGRDNDPEFDGFFAKAVGNYLMGIAFHGTPSVADEQQLERFEDEKPAGFGGFLHSMFSNLSMPSAEDLESIDARCNARIEAELQADEKETGLGRKDRRQRDRLAHRAPLPRRRSDRARARAAGLSQAGSRRAARRARRALRQGGGLRASAGPSPAEA